MSKLSPDMSQVKFLGAVEVLVSAVWRPVKAAGVD
jgi:hypothetical protein